MEGYAPLVEQLEQIQARTGFPASAFRCLRSHAEDDPGHLAALNRTLDEMTLSPPEERAVGLCALAAIEHLAALFEELLGKLPQWRREAAQRPRPEEPAALFHHA